MAGRAHPPPTAATAQSLTAPSSPNSLFSHQFYTFYCSIELFGILLL